MAWPPDAGPRSVYRLFRKRESYLAHLGCNGGFREPPDAGSRKPMIYLRIHPGADPDVLALVHSLLDHAKERVAGFEVNVTE